MLPLVVHQNGGEELGCSRWSFTRTVGRSPECPRPLHPLHKLTDRDGPPDVHVRYIRRSPEYIRYIRYIS